MTDCPQFCRLALIFDALTVASLCGAIIKITPFYLAHILPEPPASARLWESLGATAEGTARGIGYRMADS